MTGIEGLLAAARARLNRLDPHEAFAAQQSGAVLVDIRPEASRRLEGNIPGAVIIERTVLEWRLDPASPERVDWTTYDVRSCSSATRDIRPASRRRRFTIWACIERLTSWAASAPGAPPALRSSTATSPRAARFCTQR